MTRRIALLTLALAATPLPAQETKLTWHGHAAFSIVTPGGKVLLIDPWLRNPANPAARNGGDPVGALTRADYILLTHGHRDHVGDAVDIAKKTKAALVANPELAANLVRLTGFPKEQAETDAIMGIGGEITIAGGEVTVAMTPAVHSSSVFDPHAEANEPERAYGGNPAGFVIAVKNGPVLYHSGDTAYFRDMETIGESYAVDVALLNIGGHYGMEPRMAARAAKALRARLAVPHHFGTSPALTQNAAGFAAELKTLGVPFRELKVGETLVFRGREPAGGRPAPPQSSDEASTEAELKRMTNELLDAVAPGHADVWKRYTHDRLIYVSENNRQLTKEELLAELQPLPKGLVGELEVGAFKAELHGDVAVTTYIADERLDYHGQVLQSRFRTTDTWLKTGAGWRLIASQVLAVLEDPPAITLPRTALCAYNGTYRLTPEIVTKITCTGDGLSSERTGRPPILMKPEVPDVFFTPGFPRTRRIFQRTPTGTITAFVDRREGLDLRWVKVD